MMKIFPFASVSTDKGKCFIVNKTLNVQNHQYSFPMNSVEGKICEQVSDMNMLTELFHLTGHRLFRRKQLVVQCHADVTEDLLLIPVSIQLKGEKQNKPFLFPVPALQYSSYTTFV